MRKVSLLLMMLFMLIGVANAQRALTGTVTDTGNSPMPGVTVVVKGTAVGTITDINGKFTLTVPASGQVLVFSFIGMKTQEVAISGAQYSITMEPDLIGLEEIVAVGYGTVRRADLTGSVASVSNAKLMERATFSAAQALQGKAAGVVVMQTDAKPGSDASVMIRGNRSLKATNSPLYVVDGITLVEIGRAHF